MSRQDLLERVLEAAKALLESGCVNKDRQTELAKAIEEAQNGRRQEPQ